VLKHLQKVDPRLADHDDVITPVLRGAPRLGFAWGPALAGAGSVFSYTSGGQPGSFPGFMRLLRNYQKSH